MMKKRKRIKSFAAIVVALVMILSLNTGAFASGAATEYVVDYYYADVHKIAVTYTYSVIGVALPDCGPDGWEFRVYLENLEDGTKTLCPSLSYTSSADNNVLTQELMDMMAAAVDLGNAGYEVRYEAYSYRSGGESEASSVGRNAISLTDNWQETMFDLIGFASAGSGSSKYFEEGSAAPEETVYRFLNQTSELNAYVNAEGYVELPYAAYMNIAQAYFANAPEMKTYLTGAGLMDAESEQVYYYQGGVGSDWAWVLSDVESCANGYKLRGIFCNGWVEDTTGLTEYVDYYVCNGSAYAIDSAVELTVAEDDEHGYRIAAYTEMYYYLAHTEEMGDCIYGINPETDRFSQVYYCVYSNSGDYGIGFLYGTGHYTFDNHLCYTADQPVEWETAYNGSCPYGDYDCEEVAVTRTYGGKTETIITGNSGVLSGGGEITLWSLPVAVFTINAPHCTVEVLQGLTDRGDGSYSYTQTDGIELRITPDAGYEVTEVAAFVYDVYVVMGNYISASGTWLLNPEFIPSTILVTTTGSSLPTDGDGTGVTVETGEGSAAAVKVQVPEEDAGKVTGLSLVAEELDETAEENAAALIIAQAGAEEDKVYLLDIHFVNADGQEVKVGAEMLVTLPIPEGWDPDNVNVYYVNLDTGEVVDMNGVVSEDGTTVSFTTNHFSYYAVVQKAGAEEIDPPEKEPETPPTEDEPPAPPAAGKDTSKVETGDSNNPTLWFTLILLAGTGLLSTGLYRKLACRRKGAHQR